jgi:hypothetical protein
MNNYEIFLTAVFLIYVVLSRVKSFRFGIGVSAEFLDDKNLKTKKLEKRNNN